MNSSQSCPICYDPIKKPFIKLKCNHIFHVYCIYNWVYGHKKKSCPICRRECKKELDDKIIIIEKNENLELLTWVVNSFLFTVIFFLFYLIFTFNLRSSFSVSYSFFTSICSLYLINYVIHNILNRNYSI